MTFLLLNQTFYPDVMATGQYLSEVALRLVERGHQVTVVTSRRAYDHAETKFPKHEVWRGIRIHRAASTGFGKGAKWRRAADFGSFTALCALRLALLPRCDVVVALTSPPLISFLGAWLARLRGSRLVYWVMDFNPDEAIAAGWLRAGSLAARMLDGMSRFSLRRATRIIALDGFMRDRIAAKGIAPDKIAVLPPWSHDNEVQFDPKGRERFRKAHGLDGKFVVMYSGNHSPCHPLDTLLEAAKQLAHDPRFVFCFVGGGSEFRRIQRMLEDRRAEDRRQRAEVRGETSGQRAEVRGATHSPEPATSNPQSATHNQQLTNTLCLPYQPLNQLSGSLSAADLHVVVMGDPFVGLIHPCKIYNVLAVGAPVLCIGPAASHLSEIVGMLGSRGVARIAHGAVGECVAQIRRIAAENQRGEAERYASVRTQFSQRVLLPRLVTELEGGSTRPNPLDR